MSDVMDTRRVHIDSHAIAIADDLSLPWDLTEWFPRTALRAWAEEEIATLDWANPELAEHLRRRPDYKPRQLLNLLAYAYSLAVFEPEDIVGRCGTDAEFRAVAGTEWRPNAREVVRFRRENRGVLKWVVLQVLKRAVRARLGDVRLPAGIKQRLLRAAALRLNLARELNSNREGS